MALNQYGWFLDGHPAAAVLPVSGGAVLPAGKYYWEWTVTGTDTASGGGGSACGIAGATAVLVDTVDAAVNLAQVNSTETNFLDTIIDVTGTSGTAPWGYPVRPDEGTTGTLVTGTVFAFAIDTPHQKLWWKNVTRGADWSGDGSTPSDDPTTNTGGADFSSGGKSPITGNVYVLVGASMGTLHPGLGTVNFGGTAFTGTPPAGYVSIYSLYPAASISPNDNSNLILTNNNLSFDGSNVTPNGRGNFNTARSRFAIARGP